MKTLARIWDRHNRRLIMIAGLLLTVCLGSWYLCGHLTEPVDSFASCAEAGYLITSTDPPTCRASQYTFLGPRAPAGHTPPPAVTQPFEILVIGDSSGSYPKRQEVISSGVDWRHYWREIHAALPQTPPLIDVNFSTHDIIALSEGQQPTGGYNLKVTSVLVSSAGTTINVTESIPTITCTVTQAVSNRYFIVRTAKLPAPINFRISTDHRHC